jgi:hypothetical protein
MNNLRLGKVISAGLTGLVAFAVSPIIAAQEQAAEPVAEQVQAVPQSQTDTDEIIDVGLARVEGGQQSQQNIDTIADQTDDLMSQFRTETKVVDGLKVYNTQLSRQIEGQRLAMTELRQSIADVALIERQIVPLMTKMIESLDMFVEADVPFYLQERRERVARLDVLLTNVDITAAERFRKVLEAYEIENAYGRSIDSYTDTLNVDGLDRKVDILRIGRAALYYQTQDGQKSGVWDQNERAWVALPGNQNRHIRKAIRVARKQVAPELLSLPISAPEDA